MENKPGVTNEELARMIAAGFYGVDERFEKIDARLEKSATKEDMQVLRSEVDGRFVRAFDVLATKDDVKELATRIERVEESLHALTTAVDRLAKAVDDLRIEYSAISAQMSRHEKWIQQLARKLGMKLEYG